MYKGFLARECHSLMGVSEGKFGGKESNRWQRQEIQVKEIIQ